MEIIEHNLVEEEPGSQHAEAKMKGARKFKRNGNKCRGSLASPIGGKFLC